MKRILLNAAGRVGTAIMIFTEGTILKPKSWRSLYDHQAYIAIGNAAALINAWQAQGANIVYGTSRKQKQAEHTAWLLLELGFSGVCLLAREGKETYGDLVEAAKPDILIEDDCKSIGGSWQMCITKVRPPLKAAIRSIVVPEFKGIDQLPADLLQLQSYQASPK